jgi:hypothetical protein
MMAYEMEKANKNIDLLPIFSMSTLLKPGTGITVSTSLTLMTLRLQFQKNTQRAKAKDINITLLPEKIPMFTLTLLQ